MQRSILVAIALGAALAASEARAQLTDLSHAPNAARAGILKSLAEQIGARTGDVHTPGSSMFFVKRDPARSIRRGRQLFQRKFTAAQGLGPRTGDGVGDRGGRLAWSQARRQLRGLPRSTPRRGGLRRRRDHATGFARRTALVRTRPPGDAGRRDCSGESAAKRFRDFSRNSLVHRRHSDQYAYLWQTAKRWRATCQQFTLKLDDGTEHSANLAFKAAHVWKH